MPDSGEGGAGHGNADQLKRAKEALEAVRAEARGKGLRPSIGRAGRAAGIEPPGGVANPADGADAAAAAAERPDVANPLVSAPRRGTQRRIRRDDPQRLGLAIEGLVDAEGWRLAAATGSVFGRWAEIVGPDLATHTRPEALQDGELTVTADSTAWATQLRLLAAQLVQRLNVELGDGTVVRVRVRGPATPPRKPGEWRVRGGRGPRDTYG